MVSKNYSYNFELNYNDLFVKINNKYYFLVIFKANNENNNNNKEFWILGQPFIKKYSFTLNVDAKMIGFFHKNLLIEKDELQNDKIEKNENKIFNKLKKIFLILLLILVNSFGW